MQTIKVGTANVNNLFSRFDFKGSMEDAVITAKKSYEIADTSIVRRTYPNRPALGSELDACDGTTPEATTATSAAWRRPQAMTVDRHGLSPG